MPPRDPADLLLSALHRMSKHAYKEGQPPEHTGPLCPHEPHTGNSSGVCQLESRYGPQDNCWLLTNERAMLVSAIT
jgi:hypothetical protein